MGATGRAENDFLDFLYKPFGIQPRRFIVDYKDSEGKDCFKEDYTYAQIPIDSYIEETVENLASQGKQVQLIVEIFDGLTYADLEALIASNPVESMKHYRIYYENITKD